MNQLQRDFKNEMSERFVTKNVLNGFLDYTYFYFTNDFLNERKLKLGIIFNHQDISFELWLMGSTKETQVKYWNKFKRTRWNKEESMPQWYIISVELISNPDFEDLSKITDSIFEQVPLIYSKLEDQLKYDS